jgi:hypothetical protein
MSSKIKVPVSLSVDSDVDKFIEQCSNEIININGREIKTNKSKSQIYNDAILYALKHVDEWLFFERKK